MSIRLKSYLRHPAPKQEPHPLELLSLAEGQIELEHADREEFAQNVADQPGEQRADVRSVESGGQPDCAAFSNARFEVALSRSGEIAGLSQRRRLQPFACGRRGAVAETGDAARGDRSRRTTLLMRQPRSGDPYR